jgi:GntR family transcriptional regulator
MILLRLSSRSGVPPYLQIVQQVKQAIRMGLLKEGDKLPTVKEVVTMVAVNPNTVVKAYKELESNGLVEGRAGIGTFILGHPSGPSPATQTALSNKLGSWIDEALQAGLDEESTEALFYITLRNKRKGHTEHGTEDDS